MDSNEQANTENEKKELGRPPFEFTEAMIKNASTLSGQGLTHKQIAAFFGIGTNTFYMKMKEYPELREAVTKGKSKMISFVAGHLIQQIKNGSTTATIFYLKTQAGWKEVDPNDPTPPEFEDEKVPPQKLELNTNDPNEAAKVYQQIMLRGKP